MTRSYSQELQSAIKERASRYPAQARPGRFGLLTTVYVKTDATLFRETAACLMGQSVPFDRWIILAHGPISAELDAALEDLQTDPRIHVLRRPVNLGIMGGMHLCLTAADTEYVVPIDADDLLTSDALQVLSAEIDRLGAPALLYSDEDLLVAGEPQSPYWRPDWDPVLNLSSSYIWHLCCIRRSAAVEAGLYTDPEATWCHDWDTAFRLSRIQRPAHVPEILYHWRQHPASTTNTTGGPHDGSRRSTHHLLERFIAGLPQPDLYEIGDFPIFRGAPEWWVFRRPERSPPIAVIGLSGPPDLPAAVPAAGRSYLARSRRRRSLAGLWRPRASSGQTAGALLDAVAGVSAPRVLLLGSGLEPAGDQWWWEAVKLFECHPEVAVVAGLATDPEGRVQRGMEVFDAERQLVQPQLGQPADAPGPWALWLKPQCVDAAPTDFCFVETALLRAVLDALPADTPLAGLGLRLAERARLSGRLVAWSPLVRAVALGRRSTDGPPEAVPALAQAILDTTRRVWASGRRSCLSRYV